MTEPRRLPLPTWVYVILGVFTFAPLVFFLTMIVLMIVKRITGLSLQPEFDRDWFDLVLSIYVFSMWTIYGCWALGTRRLDWPIKLLCVVLILWMNIVAWPIFFIFMLRRYLGLDQWDTPRGQAVLAQWLKKHRLQGITFSDEQRRLLHRDALAERIIFWCNWLMAPLCLLMIAACVDMVTQITMTDTLATRDVTYMVDGVRDSHNDGIFFVSVSVRTRRLLWYGRKFCVHVAVLADTRDPTDDSESMDRFPASAHA